MVRRDHKKLSWVSWDCPPRLSFLVTVADRLILAGQTVFHHSELSDGFIFVTFSFPVSDLQLFDIADRFSPQCRIKVLHLLESRALNTILCNFFKPCIIMMPWTPAICRSEETYKEIFSSFQLSNLLDNLPSSICKLLFLSGERDSLRPLVIAVSPTLTSSVNQPLPI